MTSQRGQSTVEVVALVPVLAAAGLALMQVLAAGVAAEYAEHAAEAGAVAIVQGRDPAESARAALPSWSARRVRVQVSGTRVQVSVEPPAVVRRLGELLTASAEADTGPAP
jgi:hypothetical protein